MRKTEVTCEICGKLLNYKEVPLIFMFTWSDIVVQMMPINDKDLCYHCMVEWIKGLRDSWEK